MAETPAEVLEAGESEIQKAVAQQEAINAAMRMPLKQSEAQAEKRARRNRPRKVVPGANGAVRVVKVIKKDSDDPTYVYQFRYPRADNKWDRGRLNQELAELGLVLAEEAGQPKYCELSDCWAPTQNGELFCSPKHRNISLKAHDRLMRF